MILDQAPQNTHKSSIHKREVWESNYIEQNLQIDQSVKNRIYLGLVPFLRTIFSKEELTHTMNMEASHREALKLSLYL